MDGFRYPLCAQAPRCFDHFAILMLDKSDIWWQRARRVCLPPREQLNVFSLLQQLCSCVVLRGAVGINDRPRWQSKGVILQGSDITQASVGENNLARMPIFGDS